MPTKECTVNVQALVRIVATMPEPSTARQDMCDGRRF